MKLIFNTMNNVGTTNIGIRQKIKNFLLFACLCLSVIMVIFSLFPQASNIPFSIYISTFLPFIWCFVAFVADKDFFLKTSSYWGVVFCFILYTALAPYLLGNPVIGNRYLSLAQIPIYFLIYQFNVKNKVERYNNYILLATAPFILYTAVVTCVALSINPTVSRVIKSSGELTEQLTKIGIGGYSFIYTILFISAVVLLVIVNAKALKLPVFIKIGSMVVYVIFFALIILSNYFTASILLLFTVVTSIFMRKINNKQKLLIICSFVLLLLFWKPLSLFAIDNAVMFLNKGKSTIRILEIRDMITGNSSDDDMLSKGRGNELTISVNAFTENPFGGIIIKPLKYDALGYIVGFGQHSQFADTFALYGFLIGLLQIFIVVHPFIMRIRSNVNFRIFTIIFLIVVICIFTLNNVTPAIGFAIFFVYPVIVDLLNKRLLSVKLNIK